MHFIHTDNLVKNTFVENYIPRLVRLSKKRKRYSVRAELKSNKSISYCFILRNIENFVLLRKINIQNMCEIIGRKTELDLP